MNLLLDKPVHGTKVRCQIGVRSIVRASADMIAQWRRQPLQHGSATLPTSFLKHAEDQTVVALAAVFAAIAEQSWQGRSFADWGVLAAPTFFGRIGTAQTFQRFRSEGAWGVSPHLIPQQSLHGMSGAISQALTLHGPNFGIGGGTNPGTEAFLLAIAMLADGALPGLWLILTGHEAEWVPAPDRVAAAPLCHGIALALLPDGDNQNIGCLAIGQRSDDAPSPALPADTLYPAFELGAFADDLANGSGGKWRLSDSHWIEFEAAEVRS